MSTRYEALCAVRAFFASQQEMADVLGVTQPTVWRWLNQSKQLPAENGLVIKAETVTGVSRHDLRPDIYPREALIDRATSARFTGVDQRVRGEGGGRQSFRMAG